MNKAGGLKVSVIGTGYVGLTTAVALAYIGHEVTAVDKDPAKIEALKSGKSPIFEPGLAELLQLVHGRIHFTGNVEEAVPESEVIMIAVGTLQKENEGADTCFIEDANQQARGANEACYRNVS